MGCRRCGHVHGSARDNYKRGLLVYDRDPREIHKPLLDTRLYARTYSPDPDWCRIRSTTAPTAARWWRPNTCRPAIRRCTTSNSTSTPRAVEGPPRDAGARAGPTRRWSASLQRALHAAAHHPRHLGAPADAGSAPSTPDTPTPDPTTEPQMKRVSVDIGGTFTDCFVARGEQCVEGKAPPRTTTSPLASTTRWPMPAGSSR